VTFAT
jgi:solute carrier family 25 (mitochondrial thiamine pyrophosphate transporter), member 19